MKNRRNIATCIGKTKQLINNCSILILLFAQGRDKSHQSSSKTKNVLGMKAEEE